MIDNGNGHHPEPPRRGRPPKARSVFSGIPDIIKERGPAEGFRTGRDICFRFFDQLSQNMQPYAVCKLAIEFDRHALFSEMAQEKTRMREDQKLYTEFQSYLAGETEIAPEGGPQIRVAGVKVDAEPPKQDDLEDDDDTGERPEERT